ncbi:PucR family transcriptional regulator [Kitasatospora atroaurantiaca]|nr:PucR family transcriptional regulator [Kitasatospora atroaurantiaca]
MSSLDTPSIPLSALLSRTDLGLRQVAGPRQGDVPIQWVHTSEMADPAPYLLGGELLLTSGIFFGEEGGAAFDHDRYVARAVEAGAAALGFGVAPVHDRVPEVLVEACERHGLPLVEIPPPTPFVAVSRALWLALAEARHRELRRVTEAQQALATAASRPDPLAAVLRRLAAALDAWVVLLDADGRELHAAGPRPDEPVPAELAALAARLHGDRPLATGAAHAGEQHLTAHALAGTGLVLGIAARHQDPVDRSVGGMAAVLLALLSGPRPRTVASGAAVVRLMLGSRPEEVAELLGPGPWLVVRGRRHGRSGPAALGTPYLDLDGDELCALLPADAPVPELPGWTLGVSAPAPAAELPLADGQAATALRRALAGGAALLRHRSRDWGVAELVPQAEAAELARRRLAPLDGSPAVLDTLRTWLSLHGSWDRTAAALGIHRNTVRQRIARAEALLRLDLADPDTRMDVWFTLRWLD